MSNAAYQIREIPIGWLIYCVAAFSASIAVIVMALVVVGPDLWKAGQEQINRWLEEAPEPTKALSVVNFEERRRQLDAATGRR